MPAIIESNEIDIVKREKEFFISDFYVFSSLERKISMRKLLNDGFIERSYSVNCVICFGRFFDLDVIDNYFGLRKKLLWFVYRMKKCQNI